MSSKNTRPGSTVGDGFRLGIGFALASALIGLLAAAAWFLFLAGLFGVAVARGG